VSEDVSSFILHPSSFDPGKRLDAFLAENIAGWSRSRLQKLIDDGDVLVNQKQSKSSYKIKASDEIEVELVAPEPENFTPENIGLDIAFEDAEIAVINKPAGMVVHPGAGVSGGTLANAIAFHFQFQNQNSKFQNRAGIVHRLDKDTSGLIVVAKTDAAHENLSEQFRMREVFKSYAALVHGETSEERGKIEANIGRDRNNRLRMSANAVNGRNALTLWKVRERFERFTLLDVEIKTGRTHQIRVHLAWIKHPVVGDELYNGRRDKNVPDAKTKTAIAGLNRFFLHAERLGFRHPTSGEFLKFYAPVAPELENLLAVLRSQN
jgi:23S rRNA pseudouridine1911/1915/1917 synthase